jgi:AcrR family transcriptional regulator
MQEAEAGLTVGGFYKHFDSRDDLVAEAVGSALGTWERQVDAAASGGPPVTYESRVDDHFSEAHRDSTRQRLSGRRFGRRYAAASQPLQKKRADQAQGLARKVGDPKLRIEDV